MSPRSESTAGLTFPTLGKGRDRRTHKVVWVRNSGNLWDWEGRGQKGSEAVQTLQNSPSEAGVGRGDCRGPQQETSPWRLYWFSFLFLITITIFDKSSLWKEGLFWLTVWRCIVAGKAGQQGQEDTGLIASASESKQGDDLRVHSSFTLLPPPFFFSLRSQPTGWCHSH